MLCPAYCPTVSLQISGMPERLHGRRFIVEIKSQKRPIEQPMSYRAQDMITLRFFPIKEPPEKKL
jgi:hypothetical protein